MPDQSSAASEHALIQEITAPLATLPDDPVPIAANPDFPMVLRGYDRIAVDAYVKKTSQLVAELQATRSPEAAVRRALARVGEQISGILQRAHDTAAQITAQSRREAEDRLEVARGEAAEINAEAERRVKELDGDTDRIWAERQRIVDDARDLARQLLTLADSAVERFPAAEEGVSSELPVGAAAPVGEEPFAEEPAGFGDGPLDDGPVRGTPLGEEPLPGFGEQGPPEYVHPTSEREAVGLEPPQTEPDEDATAVLPKLEDRDAPDQRS
jgi:hypothetical protein